MTQDHSFDVTLDPLSTSETFNPATGTFTAGPDYENPVTDPALVSLSNGRLLAIGGRQGSFIRTYGHPGARPQDRQVVASSAADGVRPGRPAS